jgi:cathepsin L
MIALSSPDELEEFHNWAAEYIPEVKEPDHHYHQWKKNKDYIKHHNSLGHHYKLKLNQFSHMTPHDIYKQKNLKIRPLDHQQDDYSTIPAELDWREHGVVAPVQYDACTKAIVIADSVNSFRAIKTGKLVPYSAEEIVDCSLGCSCDKDIAPFDYVKEYGLCPDNLYPYTSNMCMCHECEGKRLFINGFHHVDSGNETALQVAVAKQPVMVLIDATQPSFQV